MPRLVFHSRPQGNGSKRLAATHAARVAARARDARYRSACFEQLEERRALATVTLAGGPVTLAGGPVTLTGGPTTQFNDSGPLTQFEAAVFPRLIQLKSDLDLAPVESRGGAVVVVPPLLLTRQQEPLLLLPLVDGRPVAASIDRIQATTSVETHVNLRSGSLDGPNQRAPLDKRPIPGGMSQGRLPPVDANPFGRSASALPSTSRDDVNSLPSSTEAHSKKFVATDAKAAPVVAGKAAVSSQADHTPSEHKFVAATESASMETPAAENRSPSLPGDNSHPTDFLLRRPSRASAPAQSESSTDGREYLSGVQTIILSAAAIATALVLPGIVSEIRRRRKPTLPQIARATRPQSHLDETPSDQPATTYPIREKAG